MSKLQLIKQAIAENERFLSRKLTFGEKVWGFIELSFHSKETVEILVQRLKERVTAIEFAELRIK